MAINAGPPSWKGVRRMSVAMIDDVKEVVAEALELHSRRIDDASREDPIGALS